MKLTTWCTLLGILFTTNIFAETETPSYPNGFVLDLNWGTSVEYFSYTLGLGYNDIYKFESGGSLGTVLSITQIMHPNASLDTNGKAETLISNLATLALVSYQKPTKAGIRTFQEFGLAYLKPDSKISEDTSVGASLGFGFEIPAVVDPNNTEGATRASYYVKGVGLLGLGRADKEKIASQPNMFNRHSIDIGVKAYF